jgi:hypothetical protein
VWRSTGRQDVDRTAVLCSAEMAGSRRARVWPAASFVGGQPPTLATKGRRYNSAVRRFSPGRGARDVPLVPSVLYAARPVGTAHGGGVSRCLRARATWGRRMGCLGRARLRARAPRGTARARGRAQRSGQRNVAAR